MKLIILDNKYVLKEKQRILERDRDLLRIELDLSIKFGQPFDEIAKRMESVGFSHLHIEKRIDKDMYSKLKDINQSDLLLLISNSLSEYYKDYYQTRNFNREEKKKSDYKTVSIEDPETKETIETLELIRPDYVINMDKYYSLDFKEMNSRELLYVNDLVPLMEVLIELGFDENTIFDFKNP